MEQIEVDLHLHTNYSDGALSPAELVQLCFERGLRTIAITDHDTTFGLPEAQIYACKLGMKLINGIELGTQYWRMKFIFLGMGSISRILDYKKNFLPLEKDGYQEVEKWLKNFLQLE